MYNTLHSQFTYQVQQSSKTQFLQYKCLLDNLKRSHKTKLNYHHQCEEEYNKLLLTQRDCLMLDQETDPPDVCVEASEHNIKHKQKGDQGKNYQKQDVKGEAKELPSRETQKDFARGTRRKLTFRDTTKQLPSRTTHKQLTNRNTHQTSRNLSTNRMQAQYQNPVQLLQLQRESLQQQRLNLFHSLQQLEQNKQLLQQQINLIDSRQNKLITIHFKAKKCMQLINNNLIQARKEQHQQNNKQERCLKQLQIKKVDLREEIEELVESYEMQIQIQQKANQKSNVAVEKDRGKDEGVPKGQLDGYFRSVYSVLRIKELWRQSSQQGGDDTGGEIDIREEEPEEGEGSQNLSDSSRLEEYNNDVNNFFATEIPTEPVQSPQVATESPSKDQPLRDPTLQDIPCSKPPLTANPKPSTLSPIKQQPSIPLILQPLCPQWLESPLFPPSQLPLLTKPDILSYYQSHPITPITFNPSLIHLLSQLYCTMTNQFLQLQQQNEHLHQTLKTQSQHYISLCSQLANSKLLMKDTQHHKEVEEDRQNNIEVIIRTNKEIQRQRRGSIQQQEQEGNVVKEKLAKTWKVLSYAVINAREIYNKLQRIENTFNAVVYALRTRDDKLRHNLYLQYLQAKDSHPVTQFQSSIKCYENQQNTNHRQIQLLGKEFQDNLLLRIFLTGATQFNHNDQSLQFLDSFLSTTLSTLQELIPSLLSHLRSTVYSPIQRTKWLLSCYYLKLPIQKQKQRLCIESKQYYRRDNYRMIQKLQHNRLKAKGLSYTPLQPIVIQNQFTDCQYRQKVCERQHQLQQQQLKNKGKDRDICSMRTSPQKSHYRLNYISNFREKRMSKQMSLKRLLNHTTITEFLDVCDNSKYRDKDKDNRSYRISTKAKVKTLQSLQSHERRP